MKIKISLLIVSLIIPLTLAGPGAAEAEDSVNIKILAVNPSESSKLVSEVVHTLPTEVKPEDILEQAGMEIRYDAEKNSYILAKQIELAPKETREIVIKVRNVWVIPDEQIAQVRGRLENDLKALEGTKFYETAKLLHEKAISRINQIEDERAAPIGVRQQIELYRAHMLQLSDIQKGILSLDELRKKEAGVSEEPFTVTFLVTAENPADEMRTMKVRAELPRDIQAGDILDKKDFVTLFSEEKRRFIVEKEDKFAPKEVKKYQIILRDIWRIPQEEIDTIRLQVDKMATVFNGTNFQTFAEEGIAYIQAALDEIESLQEQVSGTTNIDEKIRSYVLNEQKMRLVKRKVRELQDLMLELPLKSESENALQKFLRGVQEIQKIEDVSKMLSMGIEPDISTTWWIIFGIIVFLGIFAISFYMTWLKKLSTNIYAKKTAGEEKK